MVIGRLAKNSNFSLLSLVLSFYLVWGSFPSLALADDKPATKKEDKKKDGEEKKKLSGEKRRSIKSLVDDINGELKKAEIDKFIAILEKEMGNREKGVTAPPNNIVLKDNNDYLRMMWDHPWIYGVEIGVLGTYQIYKIFSYINRARKAIKELRQTKKLVAAFDKEKAKTLGDRITAREQKLEGLKRSVIRHAIHPDGVPPKMLQELPSEIAEAYLSSKRGVGNLEEAHMEFLKGEGKYKPLVEAYELKVDGKLPEGFRDTMKPELLHVLRRDGLPIAQARLLSHELQFANHYHKCQIESSRLSQHADFAELPDPVRQMVNDFEALPEPTRNSFAEGTLHFAETGEPGALRVVVMDAFNYPEIKTLERALTEKVTPAQFRDVPNHLKHRFLTCDLNNTEVSALGNTLRQAYTERVALLKGQGRVLHVAFDTALNNNIPSILDNPTENFQQRFRNHQLSAREVQEMPREAQIAYELRHSPATYDFDELKLLTEEQVRAFRSDILLENSESPYAHEEAATEILVRRHRGWAEPDIAEVLTEHVNRRLFVETFESLSAEQRMAFLRGDLHSTQPNVFDTSIPDELKDGYWARVRHVHDKADRLVVAYRAKHLQEVPECLNDRSATFHDRFLRGELEGAEIRGMPEEARVAYDFLCNDNAPPELKLLPEPLRKAYLNVDGAKLHTLDTLSEPVQMAYRMHHLGLTPELNDAIDAGFLERFSSGELTASDVQCLSPELREAYLFNQEQIPEFARERLLPELQDAYDTHREVIERQLRSEHAWEREAAAKTQAEFASANDLMKSFLEYLEAETQLNAELAKVLDPKGEFFKDLAVRYGETKVSEFRLAVEKAVSVESILKAAERVGIEIAPERIVELNKIKQVELRMRQVTIEAWRESGMEASASWANSDKRGWRWANQGLRVSKSVGRLAIAGIVLILIAVPVAASLMIQKKLENSLHREQVSKSTHQELFKLFRLTNELWVTPFYKALRETWNAQRELREPGMACPFPEIGSADQEADDLIALQNMLSLIEFERKMEIDKKLKRPDEEKDMAGENEISAFKLFRMTFQYGREIGINGLKGLYWDLPDGVKSQTDAEWKRIDDDVKAGKFNVDTDPRRRDRVIAELIPVMAKHLARDEMRQKIKDQYRKELERVQKARKKAESELKKLKEELKKRPPAKDNKGKFDLPGPEKKKKTK